MLRPRIIPCLLLKDAGLVKTVNFASPKYVGDPINTIRIFNEKEVDEIIVLDISATAANREPNYALIEHLAVECRMPLCYGGGVTSVEQFRRLVGLGVEKVAISAAALDHPDLIASAAAKVGSQSVVVVVDVKSQAGSPTVWTHNGTRQRKETAVELVKTAERLGAGEIVVNSIDRDGTMKGYDLELLSQLREATHLPMTAVGGAGSREDIGKLISTFGLIGAAAGSLFVFKGARRAVLVTYPNRADKDALSASRTRVQ